MPVRKSNNGHTQAEWIEIGQSGIKQAEGFVSEAYNTELHWPGVQPLYDRIRRSDPEVTIVRNGMTALVRRMSAHWELPDKPNDDEKAAQQFAEEVIDDVAGGIHDLMEKWISQVLMMGWGWWDVVPGLRSNGWVPPGGDEWRSQYDDSFIGFRRFAFRDSSSLNRWKFNDFGRVTGMWQSQLNSFGVDMTPKETEILLKRERSLHMTYGDSDNPEGLSPLEAVWRLERLKHGLEMVMGIGFEHSAGYLSITTEKSTLSNSDETKVKEAALRILTAQEGNYAAWPKGFTGELKDVRFQAADALLETIRYYGILKMTVFNMQWMAMSSLTGSGSYAALGDSSSLAILGINAIMEGFAQQFDAQVGRRLFALNADRFPTMQHRPRFKISPVEKVVSLLELGQFIKSIEGAVPLGPDDMKAIRKLTRFLPETLPSDVDTQNMPEGSTDQPGESPDQEEPTPSNDKTNKTQGAAPEVQANPQKVEQALFNLTEHAKRADPELYQILVEGHK